MAGGAYFRAFKCHVCRQRKVKCGGERPSCIRCLHSGLICTGYQRTLDFRVSLSTEPILPNNVNGVSSMRSNLTLVRSSHSRLAYQRGCVTPGLDSSYISIAPASQHQQAFLGILQELYLPEPVSHNNGNALVSAVCSTWLYSACRLVSIADNHSLGFILLAIALGIVAAGSNSSDVPPAYMRHNSISLYSKSLLSINNRIAATAEFKRHDWELLSLACFGCFSYELIINHSYSNAREHLNGIGAILQKLGPDLLTSDVLRDLYFEYRVKDITFQMIHPQLTFMSRQAWIYPRWKAQHPKSWHPLQRLLDKAYLFLLVYIQFTLMFDNIQNPESVNSGVIKRLAQLLEKGKFIESTIDMLHAPFQGEHKQSYNQEKDAPEPQIFQTTFPQWTNESTDPSESHLGKAFPTAYTFADFSVAISFVFHEAIQICITGFLQNMTNQLSSLTHEPIEHSKTCTEQLHNRLMRRTSHICQSAEYFLHSNRGITGAMVYLFPLSVAKRTISHVYANDNPSSSEAVRKLSWCQMIESKLGDFKLSPYNPL
ncbi:hypothetical protein F5884DRAFT_119893 [Xylogone sp. PMI_703]|nr:hypothetical protein F5884DRAFT_119893 [Xylogone sp. PMI_703]